MFSFSLGRVALCAPEHSAAQDDELAGLPQDLPEVVGTSGDQFRDSFTRLCLYLVLTTGEASGERSDDTVVIGTEYGNTAALARLQRDAAAKGRLLSAQYFPNATSSSASAFVNLRIGSTGRNMTVNAGPLTPVTVLWQALSALDRGRSDTSRVLIGDVYAPEAVLDAGLDTPDAPCTSGVLHAALLGGDDFTAEFSFGAGDAAPGTPLRAVHRGPARDGGTAREPAPDAGPAVFPDRNGAFAAHHFMGVLQELRPAEQAVLECRAPDGRHARVTVNRRPANSTDGRTW
ncbi:hypothetical protein [Streptomyces sp. NRRL S-118]|uniref:hypothetical protein n=1 Tax=Streptomyces sp. NRRL S-118 TaxID=1463881 RepID=UPI0004CA094C|nr:hypothetical protein [Streptomyces sp. NRRL S-118]